MNKFFWSRKNYYNWKQFYQLSMAIVAYEDRWNNLFYFYKVHVLNSYQPVKKKKFKNYSMKI